ncbi:MAG: amidohydrolase, partial [Chroococcales cyanobacterium]
MSFTISQVLSPSENGYETVDVQIEGDRIQAIGPHLETKGTRINGENKLLLPGFVNAHTHSSEFWQRGLVPPLPLELWLAVLQDTAPTEPEQVYLGALG